MKQITKTLLLAVILLISIPSAKAQCIYDYTYTVFGNNIIFNNTNDVSGSATISWTINGTTFSSTNDPMYTVSGPGSYNVCMLVVDMSCVPNTTFYVCKTIDICSPVSSMGNIPDSVKNVSYPGSTGSYNITNPLTHDGTQFTNPPISASCVFNCKSDYLSFYDLGISIPPTATISGIEVIHTRGGCNSGSSVIDTLHLAYNNAVIGTAKRDSTGNTKSDTLGSSNDMWGATLTPAIVNSNGFGVMINGTGNGICTFGVFDVRVNVYYCIGTTGIMEQNLQPSITLFPNPANEYVQLTIENYSSGSVYSIMDITGKLVQTGELKNNHTKISTLNLEKGIYLFQVKSNTGNKMIKFIKE